MQVYTPYLAYYASNSADREFMFLPGNDNYASLRLSEELKMGLYENGNRQRGDGRVLYTVVQRKMLHADVLDAGEDYIFTMDESFLPNLSVVGAYFDGRHVYDINDCSIRYEYDERTLKLDIQTNEEAYAPGKTVEATIGLSDASGRPVAGSICVGVVDESVFALQAQQVNLAWQVYQGIYYPSVTRMLSYTPYDLTVNESMDVGGMGGGGGDSGYIRKEFVDTALFQTVEAGEDGKAQVTFTLPDNIGSWRITAVAVTDDLKAGDGRSNIISSLPFYVQPIYSDTYLEGDDIAVTAAVGGLDYNQLEGPVEYTVEILDESEKTIDQLTASGEVGDRVPVNFGKYSAGNYIMRVTAQCGDYLDAEQHPFSVLKQGTTITVIETMPLDEVSGISSVRWPVGVQVYDQRLKPFMDGLQELSGQGNSARVEVLAAAWRAQVLYNNMLPEADRRNIPYDSRLEDLITEQGVKPLAAAEPSAVLTAKLLVAAPSMVEQQQGALNLFQQTLTDPAATQDERVMAYVGLAALKQPVLLDITRLAEDDTLTDTQRLWVAVGLAKLGDFTSAHKIYDILSKSILTEGNLKYLKADSRADEIQATAAALVLTSTISSPDADAFMQYFLQGENSRARVEGVLPNLEMLCYLEQYSVPSADKAGRFSCVIDGQVQEISLGEKGVKAMAFTKDAFAQADITPIEGELYAAVSYVAYTTPENATSGSQSKVQIERTYTPLDGDSITRASRVRVDLRVTFSDDAPEGCYYLSDRIPSGLRFLYGDYVAKHREDPDRMDGK